MSEFARGYIDGWQSARPGSIPTIPAYALPAGRTEYDYGLELGEAAASEG